ncbi:hypothetical protein M1N92_04530 [Dehalococcoidia bacterium]|nr:hypothetical protein [Dehalococcoidia bacterium]
MKSQYPLSCPILFFTEGFQEHLGDLRDVTFHPLLKATEGTEAIVVNRFESFPAGDRKPPSEHLARGFTVIMLYLSAT